MPRGLVRSAPAAASFAALLSGWPAPARAQRGVTAPPQPADAVAAALESWMQLDAPTGHESSAVAAVRAAMPEWRPDALGNLLLTRGSGRPRRVVACGLDRGPSHVVSEITADGFVRLQRSGSARPVRLWEQSLEGQQLRVLTRRGSVPAVGAVRSTHLARGGSAQDPPTTIADLWVDLGARSRAQAESLGVALLDPVVRDWPPWRFENVIVGPYAGSWASCALVAAAARHAPATGQTTFVMSVMSNFDWAGLAAALQAVGGADSVVRVEPEAFPFAAGGRLAGGAVRPGASIRLPLAPSTFPDVLGAADVARTAREVARAAGVAEEVPLSVPPLALARRGSGEPWWADSGRTEVGRAASLLARLTHAVGVAGHEVAVREMVRAMLPPHARAAARADSAGNVIVALGPDRDTVVFVAHLDEVGFEVTGFNGSGEVSLRSRGGFYLSLWEGQPAELYLSDSGDAAGSLRGLFVPRPQPDVKQPGALTARFGLDSAQLAERGVRPGQQVVAYKHPMRLAGTRFTARAVDDRAGTAALLIALRQIDPAKLRRKVIFTWSVREETGLDGARVLAATFGRGARRVYAVDTFVSSDSPLESTRFAYAPLGSGAVVRALDNSSVTPPAEVDRVTAVARRLGIPIQVGTTNGGNDGSVFVPYGAVDIPLSWPGRYSHSPVEVLDLLDLLSLARLVAALANEP